MLEAGDEGLLVLGVVGLGEMKGLGEGFLACGDLAGGEKDLAEDCVDVSGVGGLLCGSLGEGEGLGQTALAEEGGRG
jgi:hypothetical protein